MFDTIIEIIKGFFKLSLWTYTIIICAFAVFFLYEFFLEPEIKKRWRIEEEKKWLENSNENYKTGLENILSQNELLVEENKSLNERFEDTLDLWEEVKKERDYWKNNYLKLAKKLGQHEKTV